MSHALVALSLGGSQEWSQMKGHKATALQSPCPCTQFRIICSLSKAEDIMSLRNREKVPGYREKDINGREEMRSKGVTGCFTSSTKLSCLRCHTGAWV